MEGRAPLAPAGQRASTSSAFWQLMDRWRVPDAQAVKLMRHPGGLSKKGIRRRFKLREDEAKMLGRLLELDQAIAGLGIVAGKWVNQPVKAAPFGGLTPVAFLAASGIQGAPEISRYLLKNGLKLSVSGGG